ncbi:unnamed protein product [Gongylonema pulchrum]|uniref:Nudix hydrolase domain-containing protein n=1 Tax=Gongylonema pulchrum TaxID=637853 RepID=A0A3P7MC00_9BILA|nr:unnamed protein product [Gongylonema pulchrum]
MLKERERLKMSNEEGTLSEEIGILASVDEENWRKQGDRIRKQLAIGDLSRFAKANSRSLQRKIDEPLVFIVRHKFGRTDGYETNWLLPQVQHETGETLKQTAERCLKTVISNEVEVEGLSNAPFSVYSYNYPSRLRELLKTQSRSAVVFFFKALLTSRTSPMVNRKEVSDYKWVSVDEFAAEIRHKSAYARALSTLFPSYSSSKSGRINDIEKIIKMKRKAVPEKMQASA